MLIIKSIHVTLALLSITGFVYRGIMKIKNPNEVRAKWLKIAPHFIDTLLLVSAIYLVIISHQYPEIFNWVTAKLFALLLYILFGLYTLRFSKTRGETTIGFVLAVLTFTYIASVAITKQPWPLML